MAWWSALIGAVPAAVMKKRRNKYRGNVFKGNMGRMADKAIGASFRKLGQVYDPDANLNAIQQLQQIKKRRKRR
jgi:hypothetical protein